MILLWLLFGKWYNAKIHQTSYQSHFVFFLPLSTIPEHTENPHCKIWNYIFRPKVKDSEEESKSDTNEDSDEDEEVEEVGKVTNVAPPNPTSP